jgi:NADPH-dependent 2,4-dienoyl-CoA reductase/sulfur reductase-like enzyme
MAENLVHRGLRVTIVELLDQVMPPLDPEMATPVRQHLEKNGVSVALGSGVAGFNPGPDGAIIVSTKSGAKHTDDMIILAIGVRPETGLAKAAGLDIGERGGIRGR